MREKQKREEDRETEQKEEVSSVLHKGRSVEGADKSYGHIGRIRETGSVSARVCVEANDHTQNNLFSRNRDNRNFLKAEWRKWLLFIYLFLACLHNLCHEALLLGAVDLPLLTERQDLNLGLSDCG